MLAREQLGPLSSMGQHLAATSATSCGQELVPPCGSGMLPGCQAARGEGSGNAWASSGAGLGEREAAGRGTTAPCGTPSFQLLVG